MLAADPGGDQDLAGRVIIPQCGDAPLADLVVEQSRTGQHHADPLDRPKRSKLMLGVSETIGFTHGRIPHLLLRVEGSYCVSGTRGSPIDRSRQAASTGPGG